MIEGYEGRIGGFKTYNAVVRTVEALCDSATVCGNVSWNIEEIIKFCLEEFQTIVDPRQFVILTDEQILHFWRHVPKRSLVIIDEAHLWLPSLDRATEFREFITFATQSRKFDIDIILISQSMENVHAQIRRLFQYVWKFRDMQKWKLPILGIYWPFPQYMRLRYDYDGKTILDKDVKWKNPKIYKLYDTMALYKNTFKTLEWTHAKATKVQTQKRDWLKVALYAEAAFAVAIAACYFLW